MAKMTRSEARERRHLRVRKYISGTSTRPRLSVFRSLAEIYAQVIDDEAGVTVASASTVDHEIRTKLKGLKKTDQAIIVGQLVAERAIKKGVSKVVFDRGGFQFVGRVKALADAARKAGLEF